MKCALVCGISGQDGAYLAKLLLSKGYKVVGTSRDAEMGSFSNLEKLGIKPQIALTTMALNDPCSIRQTIDKFEPLEIYNLAGQTSVGLSFSKPVETIESISVGTLNLLEAIRSTSKEIRLFNAGSGDVFGDTGTEAAHENTPFRPCSPYAVAKASAFWQVANYREAYDLFACTGLLFNHESSLRPQHFVTQKIISGAREIAKGNMDKLTLGDLSIIRDWGWAPEYVEAMWLMLQTQSADDYVIASGSSYLLEEFVQKAFSQHGLEWQKYVQVDKSFFRPLDIFTSKADASKANKQLGWHALVSLDQVISRMMEANLD